MLHGQVPERFDEPIRADNIVLNQLCRLGNIRELFARFVIFGERVDPIRAQIVGDNARGMGCNANRRIDFVGNAGNHLRNHPMTLNLTFATQPLLLHHRFEERGVGLPDAARHAHHEIAQQAG